MATTYNYIAANKRRSFLLVALFIVILGLVGWAFSKLMEAGPGGIVAALGFATLSSVIGYFNGDKLALATSGAKGPIQKNDQPYLYNMVENLCIANGQPVPKVYLIPDQQINAFATGRDPKNASIAVTTGAIEQLENEELEGVVAHELSHVKNYDIRFMTLVLVLVGTLSLLSEFFFRANLMGGRRRDNDNNSGGSIFMIIGLVLIILAPIIGTLIQLAVSRKREFLADASGALLTRYPEGLARALEKIHATSTRPMARATNATAHMYISNPFGAHMGGMSKLFATHPPVEERVKALRAMGSTGGA